MGATSYIEKLSRELAQATADLAALRAQLAEAERERDGLLRSMRAIQDAVTKPIPHTDLKAEWFVRKAMEDMIFEARDLVKKALESKP